ncbi:MAG: DUF1800 family protein [Phycisphaerae bacterium]
MKQTTRYLPAFLTLLALSALAADALAAAPAVTSAATRRAHAGVPYDIGLPLTGTSGIECRDTAAGVTLVLNFDQAVSAGTATVTAGGATAGAVSFSSGSMLIPLTNVASPSTITVAYNNVTAPGNATAASGSFTFRVLYGDVNGNGTITVSDVNMIKYYTGQPVDGFTYRCDINANGGITVSDVNVCKFYVGTSVPGGTAANSMPGIGAIADAITTTGVATAALPFTVSDPESPAGSLAVKAESDNATLLPNTTTNLTLAGSGSARTIKLTPAAGQTGTANVTVTVGDGVYTATRTFKLTVSNQTAPGGAVKLFVATLSPEGSAVSSGSGSTTLELSADETYATVRVTYSNLTTSKTGMHVHGPADPGVAGQILFDLDTTPTQADGSWKWTFATNGVVSAADQVTALKSGRLYLNVHSSRYPGGELRGHYAQINGSQTFSPPAAPPTLPNTTPTQAEAARFLMQGTYGATDASVGAVISQGYDTYITNQFNTPQTLLRDLHAYQVSRNGGVATVNQFWNAWWTAANTANDQVRQRTAYALSQIIVVSENASILGQFPEGLAIYYDILAKGATGNFRTLLEEVTLNPMMGEFLNMRGSRKADPTRGSTPNENYAREILQLFSIGLYQLHPDGTYKLDANGQLIPTYDQNVVMGFARAFTGWNYNQTGQSDIPPFNYFVPMTPVYALHETGEKLLLNGVKIPAGGTIQSDMAAALDNIFNHPNVGPFISKQLIQRLVCSNPSPGYVYRVAQKFNNNGSGVRGDMKAVVRAILTDYEARSATMSTQQGFGKLTEPLLRSTFAMRGLAAKSTSGLWAIDRTDELGQTVMSPPTVFNFFEPGFVPPGNIATNGLVAPEFQITTETTTMSIGNWFHWALNEPGGGFKYGDIDPDYSSYTALASNPTAMVERMNTMLCGGSLPAAAKTTIINHVNTIADYTTRARIAAYLVITSPQGAVQR